MAVTVVDCRGDNVKKQCKPLVTEGRESEVFAAVSELRHMAEEALQPAPGGLTAVLSLGIIVLLTLYQCDRGLFECLARENMDFLPNSCPNLGTV